MVKCLAHVDSSVLLHLTSKPTAYSFQKYYLLYQRGRMHEFIRNRKA